MHSDPRPEPALNKLFRITKKYQASDLQLKVGQPPMIRILGDIRRMDMGPLTQEDIERLAHSIMNDQQRQTLDETGTVDFAYVIGNDECRFRCIVSKEYGELRLWAQLLVGT